MVFAPGFAVRANWKSRISTPNLLGVLLISSCCSGSVPGLGRIASRGLMSYPEGDMYLLLEPKRSLDTRLELELGVGHQKHFLIWYRSPKRWEIVRLGLLLCQWILGIWRKNTNLVPLEHLCWYYRRKFWLNAPFAPVTPSCSDFEFFDFLPSLSLKQKNNNPPADTKQLSKQLAELSLPQGG